MNRATIECPHCRGMVQVEGTDAGRQMACPLCQAMMTVPDIDAETADETAIPSPPDPPWTQGASPPALPQKLAAVPVELMSLACPSCGGMFQVPPSAAGLQLPCPTCRQMVTIPNGESTPRPPSPAAPVENEPVESLLPPGTAGHGIVPGSPQPPPAGMRPVLVPPTEGNDLAIKDRPKVVGEGVNQLELRRLTPEERARRRAVRNVVLFLIGLAILMAFIVYKTNS